jgi:hypothetical protein
MPTPAVGPKVEDNEVHVVPPSIDLNTPPPAIASKLPKPSPVPTYKVL